MLMRLLIFKPQPISDSRYRDPCNHVGNRSRLAKRSNTGCRKLAVNRLITGKKSDDRRDKSIPSEKRSNDYRGIRCFSHQRLKILAADADNIIERRSMRTNGDETLRSKLGNCSLQPLAIYSSQPSD